MPHHACSRPVVEQDTSHMSTFCREKKDWSRTTQTEKEKDVEKELCRRERKKTHFHNELIYSKGREKERQRENRIFRDNYDDHIMQVWMMAYDFIRIEKF